MLPSILSRRKMATVVLIENTDQLGPHAHLRGQRKRVVLFSERFQQESEHLLAPVFVGRDLKKISEKNRCHPFLESDFFVVDDDGQVLSQIDSSIWEKPFDVGNLFIRIGKIAQARTFS